MGPDETVRLTGWSRITGAAPPCCWLGRCWAVFRLADRLSVLVYGRVIAAAPPTKSAPIRKRGKPIWATRVHDAIAAPARLRRQPECCLA